MTVDPTKQAEQTAIARLKHGHLDGLEVLVNTYQALAVQAAYLIVRDAPLAEDIVQEAFLRAAERIYQYDENRPFKAWFLRSVVNAALKSAKRQQRLVPLEPDPQEEVAAAARWLLDPGPLPEEWVEARETRQVVWKALGCLPPEQRAAVVLRYFLGMKETEMAASLDWPLSTLRWRLRTAQQRLRILLRPFWKAEKLEAEDDPTEPR